MRVYISGPITDNEDYEKSFAEAEDTIIESGHEAINPVALEMMLPQLTYEEYMKIDLCLLDLCEGIYMLKGWQNSRGANREYGYALAKGMKVIEDE